MIHETGRALDFLAEIDDFIFQNEDLRNLALTEAEWESITQVAGWLKAFRSATTQMSIFSYRSAISRLGRVRLYCADSAHLSTLIKHDYM
jgi:hypothetical protein